MEFSLHAIREPVVAALLVEHEQRVRSELAVLVTEALERAERLPTLPVDELARMIVAVTEGSDIQVLTDAAAGAAVRRRPRVPGRDWRCSSTSPCRPNRSSHRPRRHPVTTVRASSRPVRMPMPRRRRTRTSWLRSRGGPDDLL